MNWHCEPIRIQEAKVLVFPRHNLAHFGDCHLFRVFTVVQIWIAVEAAVFDKNLGTIVDFLNSDGFVVPIHANENFVGECVTLSDEDLES